jgi:3-phosphoshikimate 1-carboxyvinyltransferase
MERIIQPARDLLGTVHLPGDKSISHRYAMLAAIAQGRSLIHGFSSAADCASTLSCLRALGVRIEAVEMPNQPRALVIDGVGLDGLREPAGILDAGNSGSTLRMLSGILAAQSFTTTITGDASLARRPMRRIVEPLRQMGAELAAREGDFPPLQIRGRRLRGIHYRLPVASAQVKTAVLFAGLLAEGSTTVEEESQTRDHTELALGEFGARIGTAPHSATVEGGHPLKARELHVPGDLSSAAFFIAAALMFPGSNVTIPNVGLNPTRTKLLDFLSGIGADIRISNVESVNGELLGDLHVSGGELPGGEIGPGLAPALIDEIPVLAVLGSRTRDGLAISGAQELRVKESDRIASVVENLRRMGARVEERPDGMLIPGGQRLHGARVESFGDHRIAMAFAIAALVAEGETVIEGADAAQVSFPEFYDVLQGIVEG